MLGVCETRCSSYRPPLDKLAEYFVRLRVVRVEPEHLFKHGLCLVEPALGNRGERQMELCAPVLPVVLQYLRLFSLARTRA